MKSLLNKKGQLSVGDAPGVVLIALFLFMIMGTSAFVLDKYQESFGADDRITVNNETLASMDERGEWVTTAGRCNFENFVVLFATNESAAGTIPATNYTVNAVTGFINWTGLGTDCGWNGTNWNVTYTFDYGGAACNVTSLLADEVEDNVSIAGMVLTISLIGIVLSILIGLFYVFTRRGGM